MNWTKSTDGMHLSTHLSFLSWISPQIKGYFLKLYLYTTTATTTTKTILLCWRSPNNFFFLKVMEHKRTVNILKKSEAGNTTCCEMAVSLSYCTQSGKWVLYQVTQWAMLSSAVNSFQANIKAEGWNADNSASPLVWKAFVPYSLQSLTTTAAHPSFWFAQDVSVVGWPRVCADPPALGQ